jgi:hypothetical protein
MTNQPTRNPQGAAPDPAEMDALYAELVKRFYDEEDRPGAEEVAARLEQELVRSPEWAGSIRGQEIQSLIAELRGDYQEAIHSREAEIRKILELHALALNTPAWPAVERQYDFSDVSDRLDLLAGLYDRQGNVERAVATLRESEAYCRSRGIPFDGQDMLDELTHSRPVGDRAE